MTGLGITAKTLQTGAGAAVTTAIPVTVSTNRLANASYDANGNMTSGSGVTMGYDEANRIASVMPTSGGAEYYGYAPDNKRMYRLNPATGVEELTLYGASGEKLAKFLVNGNTISPAGAFVWFGGKMVGPGMAQQDRLGTNRGGGRFYPYGEQIGSATGTDGVQFATYRRDGVSGLDYADQRYYASTLGRFNSPDPYQASGGASDPGSFNRYSYVGGDPINFIDPGGLTKCDARGDNCHDSITVTAGDDGGNADLPWMFLADDRFRRQPPPPPKPKPYSVYDLYILGGDLAKQVDGKTYTNCQALGDYADAAASGKASTAQFVRDFMNLTPSGFWSGLIPTVTSGRQVILYNGGDNGFQGPFQNTVDDSPNGNGDQGHHFAAFLEWGYQFGAASGQAVAVLLEQAQGLANGTVNAGDIELGFKAAQIGADLRSGATTIFGAVEQIRGLCK